ncbi:hypothetical protein J3E73DRAFT_395536 [Bipolaris maydis]|nr:hypothetical protein J3E73DRAFT_395536 [Bipolaris maydis]
MPSSINQGSLRERQTIQQLPIPARKGHNAILNSDYIQDIVSAIGTWNCQRLIIVHSKALDENTHVIEKLKEKLGFFAVASKSGVGAHSPYKRYCVVSIGSSSYSDACKIARLMHANLATDNLNASGTNNSSATNPQTLKKQHFASENASPDLILLDPEVAATSPRKLWLSSGVRAVDHCIETVPPGGNCNCQLGARDAMMGLILWAIPMGLSHAIGHQLGSVCGVMHGVTSCIMLAPVIRYTAAKSDRQREVQKRVLEIWNRALHAEESELADAVSGFVRYLELPSTLKEVGVEKQEDIDKVAESTLTDVFGAMEGMGGKEDVLAILDSARG